MRYLFFLAALLSISVVLTYHLPNSKCAKYCIRVMLGNLYPHPPKCAQKCLAKIGCPVPNYFPPPKKFLERCFPMEPVCVQSECPCLSKRMKCVLKQGCNMEKKLSNYCRAINRRCGSKYQCLQEIMAY